MLFSFTLNSFAQIEITGEVNDASTNEPLPFSNIYIIENMSGTTTDQNGKFELNLKPGIYTLQISFVGYRTEKFRISAKKGLSPLKIKLYSTDILLQEVTVYASSSSNPNDGTISPLSLQSEKIREISSAMPDVLRSVQALPGISANNEFSAEYNVRGGNKDENLVLVNGAQVYQPYHIKEAANASVGIFNVDLIKKVDLITGGFSARYGDKMSSVLNINYREGNRKNYKGSATLSLAYLDAYAEGPLGNKGSFIIGARKSYLEYILSLLNFEDVSSAKPSFYDIQGVLSYHFSPKNKLLFEFIHSGDNFIYDPQKEPSLGLESGYAFKNEIGFRKLRTTSKETNNADYFSNLIDIQSKNVLSSKSLLNFEVSYYDQIDRENRFTQSNYNENISISKEYFRNVTVNKDFQDNLRIKTFESKISFESLLSASYQIKSGLRYQNIFYENKTSDNRIVEERKNLSNFADTTYKKTITKGLELPNDTLNASSYKFSGFLENIFQLSNKFILNLGSRVDYFDINKETDLSPRISLSYKLGNQTTVRAAWGYYYQPPIFKQLASTIASDTNTSSQRATHYLMGMEQLIPFSNNANFLKFRIEGYYKEYSNLISSSFSTFDRLTYSKKNDATGYAKGVDVYLSLSVPHFYSWISYSYLIANEDILDDNIGEYPRYTDQRHTLSAVASIDFGKGWSMNTRFNYGSGYPYTPRVKSFNEKNYSWSWVKDRKNSATLPPYKRIDVRINKKFNFSAFNMDVFIDVSNVFNFKNIQGYEYKFDAVGIPFKKGVELWPVVPTLGIKFTF